MGDSLRSFIQYREHLGYGFDFYLDISGKAEQWSYHLPADTGSNLRPVSDLSAYCMLKQIRFLLGTDVDIEAVSFNYRSQDNADIYRDILGVNCQFDSEFISVTFPSELLKRRLNPNSQLRDILGYEESTLCSLY